MTRPFVQTHMFTLHGKPSGLSSRFITLNGLEGTLDLGTNEITLQTQYVLALFSSICAQPTDHCSLALSPFVAVRTRARRHASRR